MPRQDNINLKSDEEIALYKAASAKQNPQTKKEKTKVDWKNPEYVKSMIVQIGREQGLSDDEIKFALAIAAKESGFNVNAMGDNGDSYGVFQINKPAHPDYNAGLDPVGNITYGVRFAANKYRQAKGNPRLAARAYNGSGPMAERYANDFISNYLPKYSNDFSEGKIAMIDPNAPIPAAPIESIESNEAARIGSNYQNALQEARKAYDWNQAQRAVKMYADQYNAVLTDLRNNFPMATQDQIQNAANQYMEQIGFTKDFVQKQIDTIQSMNTRENLVNPAVQAYDQRSLELQRQLEEANPYNQLAKNAPIQDLRPIDINELRASQASDRFGTALQAMQDPNAPRPDYTGLRLQQAQQLEQAARYNQAVENARVTGLPIDYFLAGGGMDYNTLATLGQGRLANAQAMEQAYLQNVVPNMNRDISTMTNTANTTGAQYAEQARLAQKALADYNAEIMKQQYDLARQGLSNVGSLANTALSGANAQAVANTNVVPSIYSTSESNLTSRLNAIENAQKALEVAKMNQQQQNQPTINPVSAATGLVNAGVYGNNPALINAGASQLLGLQGYDPATAQQILNQSPGTVNRNVMPVQGMGMIMPNNYYGVNQ